MDFYELATKKMLIYLFFSFNPSIDNRLYHVPLLKYGFDFFLNNQYTFYYFFSSSGYHKANKLLNYNYVSNLKYWLSRFFFLNNLYYNYFICSLLMSMYFIQAVVLGSKDHDGEATVAGSGGNGHPGHRFLRSVYRDPPGPNLHWHQR